MFSLRFFLAVGYTATRPCAEQCMVLTTKASRVEGEDSANAKKTASARGDRRNVRARPRAFSERRVRAGPGRSQNRTALLLRPGPGRGVRRGGVRKES